MNHPVLKYNQVLKIQLFSKTTKVMMSLGLLSILLLLRSHYALSSFNIWKQVYVNESFFTSPLAQQNLQLPAKNDLTCALQANRANWSNIMRFEGDVCQLAYVHLAIIGSTGPTPSFQLEAKRLFRSKVVYLKIL